MTKKSWSLVVLGVSAFLIFIIVSLPPGVVLDRLAPYGVRASAISGSIWNGAAAIDYRNASLGRVAWDVDALSLLSGKLRADVALERIDGFARSQVTASLGGRVRIRNLDASLPVAALNDGSLPKDLQGDVRLEFAEIVLEENWPTLAAGKIEALNIVSPVPRPTPIGSFRVTFPAAPANKERLEGVLESIDGPARVQGKLILTRGQYAIDGTIVPGPNAPPELINTLQMLGPRDSQGRTEFMLQGPIGGA